MTRKKLKNIFLFLLCCLKFITKGKANKKVADPKKVLIIQLAKLGDMVCTTPMFRAVKEKYPACKVYAIGNQINKELLENNPDVDNYLIFDGDIFKIIKKLNQEKIDFACLTTPYFEILTALYLTNIPTITAPLVVGGYCPQGTRSYKMLSKLVITKPHQFRNYAPQEYLKALETIGIYTNETKKYLFYSPQAERKVMDFFANQGIDINSDFIVGIFPSVGNAIKFWPADRFAKLADYIYKKYRAKIIIFGGKNDQEQVKKMLANLEDNTKVIDSTNKFNIDELKVAISKLSLFISVDTGPIYIAEAFNIPTIDIVGPMDDNVQPPRGKFNRIVKIKREKGEIYVMNVRLYNYKEAKRQVDEITVEMVIKELDDLMKLLIN